MTNKNDKNLPINIDGMEVWDVSSLYPHVMTGRGIGKTHQVDRKYNTELPFSDLDNNKMFQAERQKILDEVLKKLDKELEILNRYGYYGRGLPTKIVMGLEHAKLLIKDMKK